jgi:hypothetical protein
MHKCSQWQEIPNGGLHRERKSTSQRRYSLAIRTLAGSVPGTPGMQEPSTRWNTCKSDARGLLGRAHIIAGEFRYIGKETDRKWEEGDDPSVLEFQSTEYGRGTRIVATEEVKAQIKRIGINKSARESGFDRKNFVRKLVRGLAVKRNSYEVFLRWLQTYKSQMSVR